MNANARKWIAALRSGEFKQTRWCLTDTTGHCCLGVACVLALRDGVPLKVISRAEFTEYNGAREILPERVREWLGLSSRQSDYNGEDRQLITDNDSGKTFAEIADIIESEPPGLFVDEKGQQ